YNNEILQIWIFCDGKYRFFITQTQFFFDNKRTKCKANTISSASLVGIPEALDIFDFNFRPRNERSHDNPTIVGVETTTKRQEKFIRHDQLVSVMFVHETTSG